MKRRIRRLYRFKVLPFVQSQKWLWQCALLLFWTAVVSIFGIVALWIVVVVQKNHCLQDAESAWARIECHIACNGALTSLSSHLMKIAVAMLPAGVVLICTAVVAPKLPLAFCGPWAIRVASLLYLVCVATAGVVFFIWTTLWW